MPLASKIGAPAGVATMSCGGASCSAASFGSWAGAATFCSDWSMSVPSTAVWAAFLLRVPRESRGDDTGDNHEDEGDRDQRQRRAPGAGLRAEERLGGVREDLRGQRGVRAAEHVRVGRRYGKDGEQQWGRLARGP